MKASTTILLLSLFLPAQQPHLIVTTDIGQDPDDTQSLVRLLHYANEFQIEGIIANADNNYAYEPPVLRVYDNREHAAVAYKRIIVQGE